MVAIDEDFEPVDGGAQPVHDGDDLVRVGVRLLLLALDLQRLVVQLAQGAQLRVDLLDAQQQTAQQLFLLVGVGTGASRPDGVDVAGHLGGVAVDGGR